MTVTLGKSRNLLGLPFPTSSDKVLLQWTSTSSFYSVSGAVLSPSHATSGNRCFSIFVFLVSRFRQQDVIATHPRYQVVGPGFEPGHLTLQPESESGASLVAQMVESLPAVQEIWVRSLGWEDPLEKGMATHSSILAWRIPWREEPGGLQKYLGLQKSRHDWSTNTFTFFASPCSLQPPPFFVIELFKIKQ